MTSDQEGPGAEALRRVLERAGGPEVLALLAEELSGADLTTLMLEVYRRRAGRTGPAEVMRRYRSDRFVAPSPVGYRELRRAEDRLVAALPEGFEVVTLAPLVPLAAHSAVGPVDPRKVVATVRGTEVAADPTNGLALEAARRRAEVAADRRAAAGPVRLAASQRVVRAQRFQGAGMSAHFQLFAVVTAGRDSGGQRFEREHLLEHLRFAARALAGPTGGRAEIRLTVLDASAAPLLEHVRTELAGTPGLDVVEDPDRATGRGYYSGLCYKVHLVTPDGPVEVADGGFTDWTRRLTGNGKERLLIGGFGVDRLAAGPAL
ncbi:hypothetical protein ACIA8O_30630 [Kitasatospora sp. NPDC051853]|uniref:hypothetical protein n=1 Tax=Kitasatospora sp. NPDC051853 TaxID=3364058 RepID=UPI0037890011